MSVGRNQLCPCGSGKKYKKCCGVVTPIEQLRSAREQRLRNEYSFWIERLNRCVPLYLDESALEQARRQFAEAAGLAIQDVSSEEWMPHVLNWLVFDTARDGQTILEQFVRREGRRMDREMQEAFRRLSLGLYEFAGRVEDAWLVRELPRGGSRLVVGISGVEPQPGQLLMGRLLPLGQRDQLFSGSMILPPRALEPLSLWLEEQQGEALRGQAVTQLYRLVVQLTREQAAPRPAGVHLVRRVYRIGGQRDGLLAALASHPAFERKNLTAGREVWVLAANREEVRIPALGKAVLEVREVGGEVLVEGDTAVIEGFAAHVESAAGLLQLTGPYEEQAIGVLTSTGKQLTPGTLYVTSRPTLPMNVLQWAVQTHFADKWLTTPHPALKGLSPLDAAFRGTDGDKAALLRLVEQVEREAQIGVGPGRFMRLDDIRPRLGLPNQTLHAANLLGRPLREQVSDASAQPALLADLEQFAAEMSAGKSEATVRKYGEVTSLLQSFLARAFGPDFRWEALRPEDISFFLAVDVPRRVDGLTKTLANHLLSVLAGLFKWLDKRYGLSLANAMRPLLDELKEELPDAYRVRAVMEKAVAESWSGQASRPAALSEDRLLMVKKESGGWRIRRENGEEALLAAEGEALESLSEGWLLAGPVGGENGRCWLAGVPEVCPPAVARMLRAALCEPV